jgi:hypothetical protein
MHLTNHNSLRRLWQPLVTALCVLGLSVAYQPTTENALQAATPAPLPALRSSSGQIRVLYSPVKRSFSRRLQDIYQKSQLFEAAVRPINKNFLLPRDMSIVLAECGFVNAFYEPAKHRIVMCYELTEYLANIFRKGGLSSREAELQALNATVFTFYHEAAHMLIHELDLPITGKEEDVADQFSALLLANASEVGQQAILAASQWFAFTSSPGSQDQFMDEHSLNQQRMYSLICILYGRDPVRYVSLVRRLRYPPERLARCEAEYVQINKSWERLLSPYMRKN